MRGPLAAALLLMSVATVAADRITIPPGDVVFDVDDTTWTAEFVSASDEAARIAVRCIDGKVCRNGAVALVSVGPAGNGPGASTTLEPPFHNDSAPFWRDSDTRDINGLTVTARLEYSPCRARSPTALRAEFTYEGRRYRVVSGLAAGCGGVWGVGEEAFDTLLHGFSPAGP